jgi:hypothetical protein
MITTYFLFPRLKHQIQDIEKNVVSYYSHAPLASSRALGMLIRITSDTI